MTEKLFFMTEKLYYQNPRQFEFEAQLVHQEKIGDLYSIILDRTCFYPEGGGQEICTA